MPLLQLLNKHFIADASHCAPQFTIPMDTVREMKQDQRLPFSAEDRQGGVKPTGKAYRRHFAAPWKALTKR
jgi:hypothetical protein